MIAAIILSAGESRRMGTSKALLPIKGKPFIEQIISDLRASKVGQINVVLGYHPEEIQRKIHHLNVTTLINKDYSKGQLSSLVTALRALGTEKSGEKIDGALVHLVDHPFLDPSLINEIIDQFYAAKKLIVVPSYRGKRGHPVLISSVLFSELLNAPLDQGAKSVVHAHRSETLEIPTEDEGVVIDLDTPEEYRNRLGEPGWPN